MPAIEGGITIVAEEKENTRRFADYSSSALLILNDDGRIEMMDHAALLASAVEALMGNSADAVFDKQIITRDGVRPFEVRLSRLVGPEGQPRAVAATLHAAGERGRVLVGRPISAKSVSNFSLFDDTTGLYNRRGFSTLASHLLKLADRMKRDIAFLVCTIEDAAQTDGAEEGETARTTADILIETFRASDAIARVGQHEFAVLAVGSFEEGVIELVARLKSVVASRNARGEYPHSLSTDTGVMPYDPEYPRDVEELLARIPGSV
ncbi:MAG: diguanylate cyclase [Chloroflexi bacterium]|nr:diguanylate cyclase [Chloroflexota bacterium]